MSISQQAQTEQERHIELNLDFEDLQYLSVRRGKPQPEVTYRTKSGKLVTIG